MTPENTVNLKKEFANFKEKLSDLFSVELNKLDYEYFDEIDFLKFIRDIYLPAIFKTAEFWHNTKNIKPYEFFVPFYGCFDAITKLMTENGDFNELVIYEITRMNRYKDIIKFFTQSLALKMDFEEKFGNTSKERL